MPRGEKTKAQLQDELKALKAEVEGLREKDLVMLSARIPRYVRDQITQAGKELGLTSQDVMREALENWYKANKPKN